MAPRSYRARLLAQLFRALVLPPLLAALVPLPRPWSLALVLLAVPLALALRTLAVNHAQSAAAARLGARLVTRVRGRYPGNIDIMLALIKHHNESYILEFHRQMFEQYGEHTLNLRLLWEDTIITIDEGQVKFILATGFDHFVKGYWVQEKVESFLGNGIFNRDGDEWKAHRALTRPFFAHERTSDFHTFDKYADDTLRVIARASALPYSLSPPDGCAPWERTTTPVDVQDLFARFTLDSASTFLFGACTDTLKSPLPVAGRAVLGPKGCRTDDAFGSFAAAFEEAQTRVTLRFRYGNLMWPLLEFVRDRTAAPTRIIRAWLDPMVKRAIAQREKRRQSADHLVDLDVKGGEQATFLEHLAESTDDTDYIRNELLNILLASRDTTAALLTFTIYFLALHPDVAARLRAEVLETVGVHGKPSYDVVRGMKYMRAVLNETLRLFPPVPLNNRQSTGATVLPARGGGGGGAGLYVPPQTPVIFLTLLIQRRADLWGADAGAFDPARWLDARVARYTDNPLMFAPFHAGPRICLGQNFAYNEASYLLVKLLQRHDAFALAPDAQPAAARPPAAWRARAGRQAVEQVWPASALTLYAKGGLWVRMRRAAEE